MGTSTPSLIMTQCIDDWSSHQEIAQGGQAVPEREALGGGLLMQEDGRRPVDENDITCVLEQAGQHQQGC